MKLETMLSWVNVPDHSKARQFYGEVLGLKQVFEMDGWAEFSHAQGAATVGVAAPRPGVNPAETKPGATIVFKVDNLDRACGELRKRGVQFEGEIYEVPGVVRIATFRDPFDNPLQLAQPLVG
jgi:predicted enzyme related to lactoylglutathione lyase